MPQVLKKQLNSIYGPKADALFKVSGLETMVDAIGKILSDRIFANSLSCDGRRIAEKYYWTKAKLTCEALFEDVFV